MIITQIKKIGKGARYSLYLDERFICTLEAEVLAKNKLKTGDEISEEKLEELRLESGDLSSFERALSYLEKGMKTEKNIRDYLLSKGYLEESVEKAVKKLKSYGYIDDEAYAENFIKTYSSLKGSRKLKYDLLAKGIDKAIIDEKLSELLLEEDEKQACKQICNKYLKGKDLDNKTKQKLFNHLSGKGFSYEIILSTLKEVSKEVEDEGWN